MVVKIAGSRRTGPLVDAVDEATPAGGLTYADRRLAEIARSTHDIAFWVRFWSLLAVVAFCVSAALAVIFGLLTLIVE